MKKFNDGKSERSKSTLASPCEIFLCLKPLKLDCMKTAAFWTSGSARSMSTTSSSTAADPDSGTTVSLTLTTASSRVTLVSPIFSVEFCHVKQREEDDKKHWQKIIRIATSAQQTFSQWFMLLVSETPTTITIQSIPWNDHLPLTGGPQVLTTDDVGCLCATFHHVHLRCSVKASVHQNGELELWLLAYASLKT